MGLRVVKTRPKFISPQTPRQLLATFFSFPHSLVSVADYIATRVKNMLDSMSVLLHRKTRLPGACHEEFCRCNDCHGVILLSHWRCQNWYGLSTREDNDITQQKDHTAPENTAIVTAKSSWESSVSGCCSCALVLGSQEYCMLKGIPLWAMFMLIFLEAWTDSRNKQIIIPDMLPFY